jgi:hypothetical protein
MKLARRAGTVAVVLCVGAVFTVGAQQGGQGGKPDHGKRREQKSKPDEARGKHGRAQPQQAQRQQKQPRVQAAPQRPEQQARAWQQKRGWVSQGGWQGNVSWENSRAQRWQTEHRTWAQRGGYGGSYIPQSRFALYFGSGHGFRLSTRPVMYLGYPRFEYSGFSFLMVDPWPEYWSTNWYDSDEVYVDYDDGYYLYNRRYPQVRLAITITL